MNLKTKTFIDFWIGYPLVALLNVLAFLLGKSLRRNHSSQLRKRSRDRCLQADGAWQHRSNNTAPDVITQAFPVGSSDFSNAISKRRTVPKVRRYRRNSDSG